MIPVGFEKRKDGHWWVMPDGSRRSMSDRQGEILLARLKADFLEHERTLSSGFGASFHAAEAMR